MDACITNRHIVVSHNFQSLNHVKWWLNNSVSCRDVRIMKPMGPRSHHIGESLVWLQYIALNYNSLPEYAVFLSDSGPHWHARAEWKRYVATAQPRCRLPLGIVLEDKNSPDELCRRKQQMCRRSQFESTAITKIQNIFGRSRSNNTPRHPDDTVCCSEMVLSRSAIRRYSIETYQNMIEALLNDSKQPWGFAFDRMSYTLFARC